MDMYSTCVVYLVSSMLIYYFGSHTFSMAAPIVWNRLPTDIIEMMHDGQCDIYTLSRNKWNP